MSDKITINELADKIHTNAVNHGFHDKSLDLFIAETTANIHGEVSEFWEAYRHGKLNEQCDKPCGLTCQEEELADIVIRALDTMKRLGINDPEKVIMAKHQYNVTRPYKHGGKIA